MRAIVIILVVAALGSVTVLSGAGFALADVAAYAWPSSVAQGDSVGIYVSTNAPWVTLTVYRQGDTLQEMARYESLPGQNQRVPPEVWAEGCGWSATARMVIPDSWPSGVYEVLASTDHAGSYYAIFTVRENDPGSTARILMVNAVATYQAYNAWGGKSLYDYNSTGRHRSHTVSFQRPYDGYQGLGDFPRWEELMVRFLEGNGYPVEYCTDLDVDHDAGILSRYALVLSVGHDEYWSYPMRRAFEDRIASGKNVAFFSGNICWWQIRCAPDLTRITCYKDKNLDPLTGVEDSLVTVNWFDDPVFRPENPMTGTSWRNGGYCNARGFYPQDQGYGDYTVYRAGDWAYAGSGLDDLDEFGWDDSIVGYECDGALFTMVDGVPIPTGADGSPLNFTILGVSPASDGHATMGYYVAPSQAIVFNAATTDWVDGLWGGDPRVIQITRNVLEHLTRAATSVADARRDGPASARIALAVAPNPVVDVARIRFAGAVPSRAELAIYGADGRLVSRRLVIDSPEDGGSVIWNGRDMRGNRVPPGIYFAELRDGAERATTKFLVVR